MQKWQIRIQEPSGVSRVQAIPNPISENPTLSENVTFGRSSSMNLVLKDPTLPPHAGILRCSDSGTSPSYWVHIPEDVAPGILGDLAIRDAEIPPGMPLQIGETILTLLEQPAQIDRLEFEPGQKSFCPDFPSGTKPWLTCSDSGRQLLWLAKKAAATSLSVYIGGETGTGKEVIAQLLHQWSHRKAGPFVPLHCGALPLSLAESELFGHVKGAFTGAHHHRPGALLQAHGGTLFLDEVGDLPMDIQVKLLRFLENGEIRAVGADRPSKANVRIICATHHPLQKLVQEKKFRQDLYYRLASIPLTIPPLRSRPKDIELLAKTTASELKKTVSPRALLRLKAHAWPGNVRELRHAIERASGMSGPFQSSLNETSFDFLLTPENIENTPELEFQISALTLEEMERIMILKALKLVNGNRTRAAQVLGIARSTLFEMLKRHHIQGPKMASVK